MKCGFINTRLIRRLRYEWENRHVLLAVGTELIFVKEINIVRAIVRGRKASGITQRDFQLYGSFQASVSKWETGKGIWTKLLCLLLIKQRSSGSRTAVRDLGIRKAG